MSEQALSRVGAAFGVASFLVTFIGFGVHGGLPSDVNAAAILSYVKSVNAGQTGVGNYLELLGYLLFLSFATYMYAVARAISPARIHWLNVLGFAAVTAYVAVSASAIAAQQLIVVSNRMGIETNTALSFYILDNEAFTMSLEIAAVFAVALGTVLLSGGMAFRVIGGSVILAGVGLFITGLVGTVSAQTSIAQVGLLLFELWIVATSIFLLIRPAPISRT